MSSAAPDIVDEMIEAQGAQPDDTQAQAAIVEEQPAEEEQPQPAGFEDEPLPDEINALLEPELEIDEPLYDDGQGEEYTYEDPDQLRAQLHKQARELEHLRQQNLRVQRPVWQQEIEKFFRFADAPAIVASAGSRREALRVAKEQHDLAKRGAERVQQHYEQQIESLVAARVAEETAKLQAAWGRPIAGPGQAPAQAAADSEVEQKIHNARTLEERIRFKREAGRLRL